MNRNAYQLKDRYFDRRKIERNIAIFSRVVLDGASYKEAGDHFNLAKPRVRDIVMNVRRWLVKYMENTNPLLYHVYGDTLWSFDVKVLRKHDMIWKELLRQYCSAIKTQEIIEPVCMLTELSIDETQTS